MDSSTEQRIYHLLKAAESADNLPSPQGVALEVLRLRVAKRRGAEPRERAERVQLSGAERSSPPRRQNGERPGRGSARSHRYCGRAAPVPPARVQRDSVDVGKSSVLWIGLDGSRELRYRLVCASLPHQCQSERVPSGAAVVTTRYRLPQKLLPLGLAALGPE